MRKYIAKDEADLVKQIQSDTELDKELEREELVKGRVVEIRRIGTESRGTKKTKTIPTGIGI